MKMSRPNEEWVAQVSLLRPGFLLVNRSWRWEGRGESGGIPHLAKNERAVGHPSTGRGIEPKSAFLPPSLVARKSFAQKRDLGHQCRLKVCDRVLIPYSCRSLGKQFP